MPIDPLSAILGGGQLLGGIASSLIGGGQRRKGSALLKKSPHLDYEIPAEAIQAASEGLPSAQYAQAMKNIQQQQATALSAANDRKSALYTIGRTQALTNSAIGNLDAANAAARMRNQQILAKYRDKGWNVKNQQREQDRAYAYGLIGAGNQNIAGGIDKGIAGLGALGYGLLGGSKKQGNNANLGYNSYAPAISDADAEINRQLGG